MPGNSVQFGNREVDLADLMQLTSIAGPIGEQDDEPDTVYLRFERETYTRSQVLQLCMIFARIKPDECDVDSGDLRLWWD